MNILFLLLCLMPLAGSSYESATLSAPVEIDSRWQEAFDYAEKYLPKEGRLIAKSDGYVYLKVDDDYIHALYPLLDVQGEGYKEPPYFRSKEASGAHISVFYEAEDVMPHEIGEVFPFELKSIVIVRPKCDTSYIVLQVESKELEQLREKYGLKPKLQGHEFHISLAKKTVRNSR